MKLYSRREFIKLTGFTVASSSLFLISPTAEAVWPWVLRFIFSTGIRRGAASATGGAIARSATRYGVSAGVRGTVSSTARSAVSSRATRSTFKSVVDLGLTGSLALSVSPNVYEQVQEYNAETIWINNGVENNFILSLQNNSGERKQAQLSYQLADVPSDRIEIRKSCGLLSAGPNDTFSFSFSISNLPYTGVKRLEALSDSEDLHTQPSGNIVVANASEVVLDKG